jgi:glycosyltransferase involved in cell wall biosynthesis
MGRSLMRALAKTVPSHILCNSRATAQVFESVKDRVSVIPIGVDPAEFGRESRNGHPRVGMIARFAPLKGQHLFVECAHRLKAGHPEAEFVLAGTPLFGEDSYAEEVRVAAHSTDGSSIRFLGFVTDVPALLGQLDIVVSPSTQPEGFGQSIVEAMMAGKPAIASACGGPAEVIEDGVTGRLVPPGDVAALSRAISDMLDHPAAAAEMGRRGRERAVRLYDLRTTTRQIEQVYEQVLGAR